jgi:hypothetical protein
MITRPRAVITLSLAVTIACLTGLALLDLGIALIITAAFTAWCAVSLLAGAIWSKVIRAHRRQHTATDPSQNTQA